MRAVVFAAVLATVGCIRPSEKLTCGDNTCPVTNVCIDNAYCVVPEAVDACGDKTGGADCMFDDRAGHCVEHSQLVCEAAVCGDNIIDEELHEQCDGTASFATQCVDLGFDLGLPTCSVQCGIDVQPCTRFGWQPIVNAPAVEMWTDGTVIAYARRNPNSLEITGGGIAISEPGYFLRLIGAGGHIFAQSDEKLWTVENGALVAIATPFDAKYVTDLAAGDDGALYAISACNIYVRRNNAWTQHTMDVGCIAHIAIGPASTGSHLYAEVTNVLYEVRSNGSVNLITGFNSSIRKLLVRTTPIGEVVIVSNDGGVGLVPTNGGAAIKSLATTAVLGVAANARFVYMAQPDGTILRWDGKTKDRLKAPAALITDDKDGHIYAYGGPIFRFSGLDFGELAQPTFSQNDEEMTSILELPNGDVIASSTLDIFTPDPTGAAWTSLGSPITPNGVRAVAGSDSTHRFVAGYYYVNGTPTMSTLWREQGASWIDTWPTLDGPFVDGLWMDPVRGDVYAAGRYEDGRGFLGRQLAASATGWDAIKPEGCAMYGIHARSASHVVAVGACEGKAAVWLYDGATWSELHREPSLTSPLRGVRVLPSGDIFAVGDGGAVWLTGSTWYVDPAVQGRSISGEDNDLWVSGAFTSIQRWDGFRWSRMTTRLLGTTVVAASKARVFMPGAANGHVILVRDEQ